MLVQYFELTSSSQLSLLVVLVRQQVLEQLLLPVVP
jgi:hypothetical protein